MAGREQKIKDLEDELSKMKYNKRTQHHYGLVRAKIAKLKEEQDTKKRGKGKTFGYDVKRTGDGTVVLVGFPSVGKSTLLNALTNQESKIGAYEFTTLDVVPGLLEYRGAKIQILDLPGIIRGAAAGKGRGKEILAVVRASNLIIFLLDVHQTNHYRVLYDEIFNFGIRVNQKPPQVKITKTSRGGLRIGSTVKLTKITNENIQGILKEFKIMNADVLIREDVDIDRFIDAVEANKAYIYSLIVVNKIDEATRQQVDGLRRSYPDAVFVSGKEKINIDELKDRIFERMELIRVYMKEPGKEADTKVPLIMWRGCTIEDVCNKLHREFVSKFKFARVWGRSVKFDAQKIMKKSHQLEDEDILELHLN
ncbi:GTP-binding protein [Candidatus Woesearchaeota archaeon]|nr:GTP-binding protein [Candidatus Woesearchaeota archaeon]